MTDYRWHIQGYTHHKHINSIFETILPFGAITQDNVKQLLKCLAAKDGFDYEGIIGGYVKKGTKLSTNILDVKTAKTSKGLPIFICGEDPIFIATLTHKDDLCSTPD